MSGTADGVVTSAGNGLVVFKPAGTTYQLHLQSASAAQPDRPVKGTISVKGRKIWTLSAGGSFISPLVGSPRIVQGMVKAVDGKRAAIQAGTLIWVQLPDDETAFDLKNGPLVPGAMVNITTYPGATFDAETANGF